jgi:hypothetical protein
VRLAHRVKELDELPHNLSAMPSINKVKDWYAQSFEVPHVVRFPHSNLTVTSLFAGIDHVPSCENLERRTDGAEVDFECVDTPPGVGAKPFLQRRSG